MPNNPLQALIYLMVQTIVFTMARIIKFMEEIIKSQDSKTKSMETPIKYMGIRMNSGDPKIVSTVKEIRSRVSET
jgi:hypothetical protein